jgi:hypothetical protein
VVFGRKVLQARDPARFVLALCDVVKRGADPNEKAARYELQNVKRVAVSVWRICGYAQFLTFRAV